MSEAEVGLILLDKMTTAIVKIWDYHESKKNNGIREHSITPITSNIDFLLNYNIFIPLRYNLIETIDSCQFIPRIIFDPSEIQKSDYFEEGLKHLEKDIPNFRSRFENLENRITKFNSDLDTFETSELERLVSEYLEKNGFIPTMFIKDLPTTNNTILVPILLPYFRNYWKRKERFNYKVDDKWLKINNVATIGLISEENESKIDGCMEGLKHDISVCQKHMDLIDNYNSILKESETLTNEIGKKIVIRIEKGIYDTVCSDCEKYKAKRQ